MLMLGFHVVFAVFWELCCWIPSVCVCVCVLDSAPEIEDILWNLFMGRPGAAEGNTTNVDLGGVLPTDTADTATALLAGHGFKHC